MPDHHTSTRPSSFARLTRSAGPALILALLLFAGGYAAGQDAQPTPSLLPPPTWLPPEPPSTGGGSLPPPGGGVLPLERLAVPLAGGVGLVTPEQVLAVDLGTVQLVDVRSREAYDFSHASGSIAMPETEMVQQASSLPSDRTLVLYCTCPDEKTSLRAARTLAGVFHVANIVVLEGGLDAYAAAGGAVTSAAADSAIAHQGCGCSTNAPAYKLWAGNLAAERMKQAEEEERADP